MGLDSGMMLYIMMLVVLWSIVGQPRTGSLVRDRETKGGVECEENGSS